MSARPDAPMPNIVCKDEARAFAWENLTGAFYRPEDVTVGRCTICGAENVPVKKARQRDDFGLCAAQRTLTQKRHTSEKDRPVAYGEPLDNPDKRGKFSLVDDKRAMLVSPSYSVTSSPIVPEKPLPGSAHIDTRMGFEEMLEKVMDEDLTPYLLGDFTRMGGMPMRITHSPNEILVNGRSAVIRLDRERLRHFVTMLEEHEIKPFETAASIRGLATSDRAAAITALEKLRKKNPELAELLETNPQALPNGTDTDYEFAKRIVASRQRRAKAAAEITSQAE